MNRTGFSYSGTELASVATADNYYRWIMRMFGGAVRGRVLEVGAGLGTVGEWLLRQPGTEELVLLEPADNLFAALARRFAGRAGVSTVKGYLDEVDLGGPFDTIVLINVLEHVADDASVLARAYGMLRPGGSLLLFVPALPALYGTLDAQFEHYRRYTRAGLARSLRAAGFPDARLRYVHAVGIAGWLLAGKLLRRRTISPAAMRLYDRLVIPWVAALENVVAPPIGQSLLATARRPPRQAAAASESTAPAASAGEARPTLAGETPPPGPGGGAAATDDDRSLDR